MTGVGNYPDGIGLKLSALRPQRGVSSWVQIPFEEFRNLEVSLRAHKNLSR
jgi:hypothetical protein